MGALQVSVVDHVATVVLDRPPVNSLDRATEIEMKSLFDSFNDDFDIRAVVLTGAGNRAFSAGTDLRAPGVPDEHLTPRRVLDDRSTVREMFWSIRECAVPVIGAVNGPAIGAGLALTQACDVLFASENARFGLTEINVGLLGGYAHLAQMVGHRKAREMYYSGELASAAELLAAGAVRAIVPFDELMTTATAFAQNIASKSPIAVRLAKDAMNRVDSLPLKDAYRIEQEYTYRLRHFEDSMEARQAYLDKRDAEWKWR
ncbi:MAG: enoyl-CoA hydratase-related protein [Acidimicrobiia bacterium]